MAGGVPFTRGVMTWFQFGAAIGVGIGIGIESVHTELNGLPNAISIRSKPTPILVNGYKVTS